MVATAVPWQNVDAALPAHGGVTLYKETVTVVHDDAEDGSLVKTPTAGTKVHLVKLTATRTAASTIEAQPTYSGTTLTGLTVAEADVSTPDYAGLDAFAVTPSVDGQIALTGASATTTPVNQAIDKPIKFEGTMTLAFEKPAAGTVTWDVYYFERAGGIAL